MAKICTSCGAQNKDDSIYCEGCGTKFAAPATPSPQPAPQTGAPYQNPEVQRDIYINPVIPPKPVLSQNPLLNAIKTAGSSTMFLIAIIIFSAGVFFDLINAFSNPLLNAINSINEVIRNNGGFFNGITVTGPIQAVTIAISILSLIPTVMIGVGLWLFYSKSAMPEDRTTTGLTIMKVITIITLVGACLFVLLMIGFLILFIVTGMDMYNYAAILAAVIVVVFVLAIYLAILIGYQVSILKTIGRIKETITQLKPQTISSFLMVMNYIFAGITFIAAIAAVGSGLITFLINLCNAAFLIMIAIGISSYNKSITEFMFPIQNAAPPPPYNPYPPAM